MKLRTKPRVIRNRAARRRAPNPLRLDSTRTLALRRAFAADLTRRFNSLKARILKLVEDEDAFGLAERKPFSLNRRLTDAERMSIEGSPGRVCYVPGTGVPYLPSTAGHRANGVVSNVHGSLFGYRTESDLGPDPDVRGGYTLNEWVSSTKVIEVEDIRQLNHWECGAAATTAVNRYYGVGARTVDTTAKILGTNVERSTHPDAIIAYERVLGLRVEARALLTVDDLADYAGRGWPVIVCVQDYMGRRDPHAAFDYGHYLTVIGVVSADPRYVVCQDSSLENWARVAGGDVPKGQEQEANIDAPGRIMVREDDWLRAWHDQDADGNPYVRFGIAVGPPATTMNFDPNQARDAHGRFGSGGGGAAKATIVQRVKAKIADKLHKMEARYGRRGAIAVMAGVVALTPIPLPGTSLAPIAIAEGIRAAHRLIVGNKPRPATNEVFDLNELVRAVREMLADLYADEGVPAPKPSDPEIRQALRQALAINSLTVNRWEFRTGAEKIKAFKEWLEQQLAADVLGSTEDELWRKYIEEGFRKGAGRAFDDVKGQRWGPHEGDFYRGSKEQFLRDSFGQAVAQEKVKLLAGRTFNDLEGVTDAMGLKMSRVLTDGLVQGKGPRDIARDLTKEADLSRERALTVARTEIIRAHAEGQLMALESLGVAEVGVAVEWSTSGMGITELGNPSPCELCAPLEGIVLKISEAKGMLPRHPN